jgi:predicted acylesterase/phospholipase RssA
VLRTPIRNSLFALTLILAACGGIDRAKYAPPAAGHAEMYPIGFPDVRYFGDEAPSSLDDEVKTFGQRLGAVRREGDGLNILALSGGGSNGAFGAGVINGWTKSGTRPEFDIVTGISTGSLIAPFAFLGPKYDANLKRVYTTNSTSQLATKRILAGIFNGGSLYNTAPLRKIIETEFTDAMIDELSAEYARGRLLLIGTTNMDAERQVIWNLTEIASYQTPAARKLVRDVIWASAAIPILFTPVRFNVTNGAEEYTELHADGGLAQEIFTYSPELPVRRYLAQAGLSGRNNRVWVIHNNHINPVYQPQKTNLRDIGERTIATLIKSQSVGDLLRIAALARRDGFSLGAMILPAKFTEKPKELFDPAYMTRLFALGEDMGLTSEWGTRLESLFEQDKREGERAIMAEAAAEIAILAESN